MNDLPAALALAEGLGLAPIADAEGVPTRGQPDQPVPDARGLPAAPPQRPGQRDETGHGLACRPVRRTPMADFTRPPTAQGAVLAELRSRILSGTLPAGSALRQEELSAQLGVSRVPVREALRMLEVGGPRHLRAHRGYRVVELRIEDLEEIYHLRGLIEDDLVRRAVGTWSEDDLTRDPRGIRGPQPHRGRTRPRPARARRGQPPVPLGDPATHPADRADTGHPLGCLRGAIAPTGSPSRRTSCTGRRSTRDAMAAVEDRDADALMRILAEHRAGAIAAFGAVLRS